jgi:hypothetical protein
MLAPMLHIQQDMLAPMLHIQQDMLAPMLHIQQDTGQKLLTSDVPKFCCRATFLKLQRAKLIILKYVAGSDILL